MWIEILILTDKGLTQQTLGLKNTNSICNRSKMYKRGRHQTTYQREQKTGFYHDQLLPSSGANHQHATEVMLRLQTSAKHWSILFSERHPVISFIQLVCSSPGTVLFRLLTLELQLVAKLFRTNILAIMCISLIICIASIYNGWQVCLQTVDQITISAWHHLHTER